MTTQHFNPLTVNIAGTHLIEASAGTGKTWSIAALYTRLVILEQIPVDKILVVTFTKAATAELKMRLRARLDEVLVILLSTPKAYREREILQQQCGGDVFLFNLLCQALEQEREQLLQQSSSTDSEELDDLTQQRLQLRLKAAISEFDRAAIYTIHAFCQRVLQDFAFYCQEPFAIELEEDSEPEYQLIAAQDFWREQVISQQDLATLVYELSLSPQSVLHNIKGLLSKPYLKFKQEVGCPLPLKEMQERCQLEWQNLKSKLSEIEQAFWQIYPSLNGNSYRQKTYQDKFERLKNISEQTMVEEVREIISATRKDEIVNLFSSTVLTAAVKKNAEIDEEKLNKVAQFDTLYALIEQIIQTKTSLVIALEQNFIKSLQVAQEQYKKEQPKRQFDDLLLDVFNALKSSAPHAKALADAMSSQWQVALIDEFQDTDPLQYDIFRIAFGQPHSTEQRKRALFLVGDPKQAIYSFRGADVFAYLQAANDAPEQQRYTLDKNYRSHAKLVNSVNALFNEKNTPFALPEIHYPEVSAARAKTRLTGKLAQHAVVLHWLNQEQGGSEDTETLSAVAAQYCAKEIAHTLSANDINIINKQGIKQKVEAGQIAVLVRKRHEGQLVQDELKRLGVQSVLLSQNDVFGEEEAEALYALLGFILNPLDTSQLIFVLAGCLFDYTAEQLLALEQDNQQLLDWIKEANDAVDIWKRYGVYSALQSLLGKHQVEQRLLSQRRQRSLTNLHQLLELIAIEDKNSYSHFALHQWLGKQIQAVKDGHGTVGEALLRLESDENLVKIVTIHASKGLQYPIVYCPFIWMARNPSLPDWWVVHHQEEAILVHKNQCDEHDEQQIEEETLSEDLRLLYVALTRAEEQLHLYLAGYSKSSQNVLAYLLGYDNTKNVTEHKQAWQAFLAKQDSKDTDFAWIDHITLDTDVSLLENKESSGTVYIATQYPQRQFESITHTSFTGLTRTLLSPTTLANQDDVRPTLDIAEQQKVVETETLVVDDNSIFAFPKGVRAGICLHEIMEHYLDAPMDKQAKLVANVLQQYDYDAEKWTNSILKMANDSVNIPLLPQLNLNMLPEKNRLAEMGFLFHSEDFKLSELKNWFKQPHLKLAKSIQQATEYLSFRDVNGFISGFIDLFVYTDNKEAIVIDYKSNYLGHGVEHYQQTALDQTVGEHHYYLQAFIYAVAVTRYLNSRQQYPKEISIRYLFLRGIDGITDNGVWAWDIPTKDLQEWL